MGEMVGRREAPQESNASEERPVKDLQPVCVCQESRQARDRES
jgi:hypothetical protein